MLHCTLSAPLLILYYLVIRVPAAFVLSGRLGLEGIWFAFLFSHILAAAAGAVMTGWCRREKAQAGTAAAVQL